MLEDNVRAELALVDLVVGESARGLLDAHCPASALRLLTEAGFHGELDGLDIENAAAWENLAEALVDLDRGAEAQPLLETLISKLSPGVGSTAGQLILCRAHTVHMQLMLRNGQIDRGILSGMQAESLAASTASGEVDELRAWAQIWCAVGYEMKRCHEISETYLHKALELAPTSPRVLAGLARLRIEQDQRLAARRIYSRMTELASVWAAAYGEWGLGYIAYLLGEFDQAEYHARQAVLRAPEMVSPIFILAQTAIARSDAGGLRNAIDELRRRSPHAEMLTLFQTELETLDRRLGVNTTRTGNRPGHAMRLEAFPTLVQYQDTCGPAVVELVLRYWAGNSSAPPRSEAIAAKIKYPHAGTPIYRMREYFHLYGFDTVRCMAPVDVLKRLVDAGLPVIIQQEFSNTAHVSVVIGYDEESGVIELQDPMTHVVLSVSTNELGHLRRNYLDAALIAYPRFAGHEKTLARLGVYNDPLLEVADRVIIDFDQGRYAQAASFLENNIRRRPEHALSWILLLHARNEILASKIANGSWITDEDYATARRTFYATLEKARKAHPSNEFVNQFEGWGALNDRDYVCARSAFSTASELDPEDARNHAFLAECHFSLYSSDHQANFQAALESAWRSVQRDPSLPAANIWMARGLIALQGMDVVGTAAVNGEADLCSGPISSLLPVAVLEAWHYARSAVALEPRSGMAHLALAEVLWFIVHSQPDSGLATYADVGAEIKTALSLSPGLSGAVLLRARMSMDPWEEPEGVGRVYSDVRQIIKQERTCLELLRSERETGQRVSQRRQPVLPTMAYYEADRVLIDLDIFHGRLFEAEKNVDTLLADFPADPGGLALRAEIYAETLLAGEWDPSTAQSEAARATVVGFYTDALSASPGDVAVLEKYLAHMEALFGAEYAMLVFNQFVDDKPLSGNPFSNSAARLSFLHARLLSSLGKNEEASRRFLHALAGRNGIRTSHELFETMVWLIDSLGIQEAEHQILAQNQDTGCISLFLRRRTMGLVLVTFSPDFGDTREKEHLISVGRRLLGQVLQEDPEDAQVTLALGHAAVSPADRETLYRRALMIAPNWGQARAVLADFLTETGRPEQALDYTRGYVHFDGDVQADRDQVDLESAHARALLGAGHFEEAAQVFSLSIKHAQNLLEQQSNPEMILTFQWLHVGCWQAEVSSGQLTQALKTARKALRLCAAQPDLRAAWYLRLAENLRRLGRYDDADQAIARGRAYGLSKLDSLRAEYETILSRKELHEALQLLDEYMRVEASEVCSGKGNGRLGWAEAERLRLMIQLGQAEEVVTFLSQEGLDAEGWGQAAWNLALSNAGTFSDSLALEAAERSLNLDPTNHAGLFTRAESLSNLGREDEAVAAWIALRDAYPEDHTAYEKLAIRLVLTGDLTQGFEFADRAVTLGAFCPFSWAARGLVLFFSGRDEEALADLHMAWNRADLQQRRKNQVFWLIFNHLWLRRRGGAKRNFVYSEMDPPDVHSPGTFEARLLKAVQIRLETNQKE